MPSPQDLCKLEAWTVEQHTGILGRVKEVVSSTAQGWKKSLAAFPWLAPGFFDDAFSVSKTLEAERLERHGGKQRGAF